MKPAVVSVCWKTSRELALEFDVRGNQIKKRNAIFMRSAHYFVSKGWSM